MIESFLFGSRSLDEMKAGLDAGSLRQRVIAANIANANTPGYEAQRVQFEELLGKAMASNRPVRTHPHHLSGPVETTLGPQVVPRGGEVALEQEMVELQQNAIHYRALSQFVARRYRGLLDAIGSEG